jgi:hypothetical protein
MNRIEQQPMSIQALSVYCSGIYNVIQRIYDNIKNKNRKPHYRLISCFNHRTNNLSNLNRISLMELILYIWKLMCVTKIISIVYNLQDYSVLYNNDFHPVVCEVTHMWKALISQRGYLQRDTKNIR